jgi:flagellar assembly protein FliH
MDAVIRAALLAPFRTRLSETGPVRPVTRSADATTAASHDDSQAAARSLRSEIERQVRAEMLAQNEKVYAAERERAHADGYADGLAEAADVVARQSAESKEQLRAAAGQAISALQTAHAAALSALQSSVGEIAFAAVCRLIGEQAASQTYVLGLVDQVCRQLRGDTIATARLHPRDIATLHDLLPDGSLAIHSLDLKVVADESLQLGGCVIEAASGRYDGALDAQLQRLHALLSGKE